MKVSCSFAVCLDKLMAKGENTVPFGPNLQDWTISPYLSQNVMWVHLTVNHAILIKETTISLRKPVLICVLLASNEGNELSRVVYSYLTNNFPSYC